MALGALDTGIGRFFDRLDVLAVRVTAATDELAVATVLDDEVTITLGALTALQDLGILTVIITVQVACVVALRVTHTTDKAATPAEANR